MRGVRKTALWIAVMLGLALPECASAAELTGAWAADADRCDKVFVRRGRAKQIDFAEFPGVHGGGFIIDADQLKGKFAECKIKTRKEDGQSLNLIAACATDIMLCYPIFSSCSKSSMTTRSRGCSRASTAWR
jgi:hypothetical protein